MPSLNKIRKDIGDFFNSHYQVHSYFYGSIDDYVAKSDKEYFSVNVEFNSANVSGKYINYQFSITVADLMDLNYPESEHDGVSDCVLIANDFLAYLTSVDYTYTSANMQPFREDMPDITAGIVLGLTLQLPLSSNECAIPMTTITSNPGNDDGGNDGGDTGGSGDDGSGGDDSGEDGGDTEPKYAVEINFNNGYYQQAGWNNVKDITSGDEITGLVNTNGDTTTIGIRNNYTLAYAVTGVTTGDNSGVYPDTVLKCSIGFLKWQGTSFTITIIGLDTNSTYKIDTLSNTADASNNVRTTIGTSQVTVDAGNNTSNLATFTGVTPDENGEVLVTLENLSSLATTLNAMVITPE